MNEIELEKENINQEWVIKHKSQLKKIIKNSRSHIAKVQKGEKTKRKVVGFAIKLSTYRKIIEIIRHFPKKYNINKLGLTSLDWQNVLYIIICVDKKKLNKQEILCEFNLNPSSQSPWINCIKPALDKLIRYKRVISVRHNKKTVYLNYYDKVLSRGRDFDLIDPEYVQCYKCKRVSTKIQEEQVKLNGGLPYHCYCEFLKGGRLIKMRRIRKKDYNILKNDKQTK